MISVVSSTMVCVQSEFEEGKEVAPLPPPIVTFAPLEVISIWETVN